MTIAPGAPADPDDILAALARHGVKLHHTQSVPSGVATNLLWGTEDEDTDQYHGGTAASVTIPTGLGGLYAISYGFLISGITIGTRAFGSLTITTSVTGGHSAIYRAPTDQTEERGVVAFSGPLLAGDSFVCDVFHSQTANLNVTGHLSCYRVGL